ncbi:hypothetical protein RBU60_03170 [Mesonia sp. MT50]|uniref:Uncharacterized protein n=1 Tax=Mesonia profundi TaxID=3070998 RepID=A0ABU0ZYM0_9FLAO|nr:hypothetical protein [Mesonia profundi]MDQ7916563.1 hypothetical protein [Mesonia profundi]
MKKASQEQLERLFQFTNQHFVDYYDVQLELVDHLANAIEEQWQENPEKDFETALQEEFKKFGVFGFLEVVEARQIAMQKRYYQLMWKEAKEFLKLPKVFMTAACFMIIFTMITTIPNGIFILAAFLLPLIVVFFSTLISKRKKEKAILKNNNRKPYLLESLILQAGQVGSYIGFPIQVFIFIPDHLMSNFWVGIIYGALLTGFGLVFHITLFLLPRKRDEILREAYPELKWQQV